MNEFLHMGGYGGYIWSAYAITAVVLILSIVLPIMQGKKTRKRIEHILEQEQD